MQNLERGRCLAWDSLRPAFDHAIALAKEAEHLADSASNTVLSNITPSYPPLVEMLAHAGESTREDQS